jgi:hypothetical protein
LFSKNEHTHHGTTNIEGSIILHIYVDNNAPNKIKQQSLMSHLDGWAQQQTY